MYIHINQKNFINNCILFYEIRCSKIILFVINITKMESISKNIASVYEKYKEAIPMTIVVVIAIILFSIVIYYKSKEAFVPYEFTPVFTNIGENAECEEVKEPEFIMEEAPKTTYVEGPPKEDTFYKVTPFSPEPM